MKNTEFVITTPDQLKSTVKNAIAEYDREKENKKPSKLYSVNKIAKILGKSYNTVRKYVDEGLLEKAANGEITERSLNEFLGNQ